MTEPSILEHLAAHLPGDAAPGLTAAGYRLPDQQPVPDGALRWPPEALEGVLSRRTRRGPVAKEGGLLDAVRATRRRFGRHQRAQLYALALRDDVLDGVADVIRTLAVDGNPQDLATARWLAFEGRHLGPVQLGIALLSLGHDESDRQRLLVLARHDELSCFVLDALSAVSGDPEGSAYAVAQVAYGWGRVEAVERLNLADQEVRRWLVCGGYVNSEMDDYTAIYAASADLLGQLERMEPPDPELVDGAVGVLLTLVLGRIQGSPGRDIGDYPDGPAVLELLLDVLDESDLRRFQLARAARTLLELPPGDTIPLAPERRQSLLVSAERILADPEWPRRTARALSDWDNPSFGSALEVGRSLGLDIFPAVLAALECDPASHWWWDAVTSAGSQRFSSVVQLAERHLIREDHNEHGALLDDAAAWVLWKLPAERPGLGWPLVKAALKSGQMDRWKAYSVLDRWGPAQWPAEAEALLQARLASSPDESERNRLLELLDGTGSKDSR